MPHQTQKYVIVGGAGLVGSAVAHALVRQVNASVIICDTFGSAVDHKWAAVPLTLDDIWRPGALISNLERDWRDIAGVILLADTNASETNADLMFETAFHLPRQVWDFCAAKQRPLYWASSAHVYGNAPSHLSTNPDDIALFKPANLFGRAKLAFDMFAARQGIGPDTPPVATGFRLSSVYGPNEAHKGNSASLVARARFHAQQGTTLSLWENSASMVRDWVHVDDAAAAMVEIILAQKSGFYDVGTGTLTSVADLVAHVSSSAPNPLAVIYDALAPDSLTSLPAADVSPLTTRFRTLQEGMMAL